MSQKEDLRVFILDDAVELRSKIMPDGKKSSFFTLRILILPQQKEEKKKGVMSKGFALYFMFRRNSELLSIITCEQNLDKEILE